MFHWSEGQEFHIGNESEWTCLTLGPGMVIEVLLDPELAAGAEDLWGGFLVYAVEVADTGEWLIMAKSLGCSDSDVSRTLSGLFNRRVGVIHLCRTQGCHGAGEFAAHATSLQRGSSGPTCPMPR